MILFSSALSSAKGDPIRDSVVHHEVLACTGGKEARFMNWSVAVEPPNPSISPSPKFQQPAYSRPQSRPHTATTIAHSQIYTQRFNPTLRTRATQFQKSNSNSRSCSSAGASILALFPSQSLHREAGPTCSQQPQQHTRE